MIVKRNNLNFIKNLFLYCVIACSFSANGQSLSPYQWSKNKANQWYENMGWISGCNFVPSTASNQIEMWQKATFDTITINKELGWAEDLGFKSIRVYLHYLVWEDDSTGLIKRVDNFLDICKRHNISVAFVLFDDCHGCCPELGPQKAPTPGIHNSRWVQCPGKSGLTDSTLYPGYRNYTKGILRKFAQDERVAFWDLYNEPGASDYINKSLPLLKNVFRWAREVNPSQPITSCVWLEGEKFDSLNHFVLNNSDIITFHNYSDVKNIQKQILSYKKYQRPIICTEYMARTAGSTFQTHLPLMKKLNVSCYNWGLVSGKSQTIYPWGSKEGAAEPAIWFHEILRSTGTAYDLEEVNLIKKINGKR